MSIQKAMLEVQAAVDSIISKARNKHAGIPDTVVVIGASGGGKKHGHYMPKSWKLRDSEDKKDLYGEILLAGESLSRGAVPTLGTVLHELVHAYCNANDVQDTSNGNRYHNTKFKDKAEEFGLSIEKAQTIGWSVTTVPETTQDFYREELDVLEKAIKTHRLTFTDLAELGLEPEKKKALVRKMQCPECEEPLVVTKKWWEKQGNGGDDYEYGVGLICRTHDTEYEIFEEGGEDA